MNRPSGRVIEISLALDGEAAEAVCALFERHGGGAVVETRVLDTVTTGADERPRHWVRTYLPEGDVAARARVEVGLWHLGQIYPLPEAAVRRLSEANWAEAWKAFYAPLRIGRRFLVVPSWLEPEAGPADLVIRLDPGTAFGTGLHPTTQLCLAALETAVRPGDAVLDVGTGSGILAIGAGRLGAGRIVALDIDPRAVETAAANAARNGVAVETVAGRLADLTAGAFDVVVANLLATTVGDLAAELVGRTRPGGVLIASGVLDDQAASVTAALTAVGLDRPRLVRQGDWVALIGRRSRRAGRGR